MTESRSHPTDPFGPLKLQTAQLILAGFRRDSYAGVLQPVPNVRGGLHICDLFLDGLGRRLQIKARGLFPLPDLMAGTRPTVALHGLPILVKAPRTELVPVRCDAGAGQQFTASFDMHVATLRLGILRYLPAPGASHSWICVLEILRGEGC